MVTINYNYNITCKTETDVKIAYQEHKDTYIVGNTLGDIFKGYDITVTQTPQFTHYDLDVEITSPTTNKEIVVEVKEFTITDEAKEKYGENVMLKANKLMNMQNESKNKKLIYCIILNKKELLLYDCSKLDWANMKLINLHQLRTQMNPKAGYVVEPTYIIPTKYAIKRVPCDFNYWCYENLEDKPTFKINV